MTFISVTDDVLKLSPTLPTVHGKLPYASCLNQFLIIHFFKQTVSSIFKQ